MAPETFWKIVDKGARSDDPEETLRASLARLSPQEIAAFDKTFFHFVDEAMTWDLWGAAYLAMGGCSDDGFEYVRRGIVARGRKFYERAVANPDSLAKVEDPEDLENEEIGYVAAEIYEQKTGKRPPRLRRRARPAGRRWDFEDERACSKRLPKLSALASEGDSDEDVRSAKAQTATTPTTVTNRAVFDAMVIAAWEREATDVDDAIRQYEAALAFVGVDGSSPMFTLAHRNLAFHLEKRGDVRAARPHVETALRTRKSLVGMLPYLARVEAAGAWFLFRHAPKRIDEALALARSAQRHPTVERETLMGALDTERQILLKLGRKVDAQKVARRALAIDPEHRDFQHVAVERRARKARP